MAPMNSAEGTGPRAPSGTGRAGLRRWLGVGLRLLVTLLFLLLILALSRCSPPPKRAAATPTFVSATARVQIEIQPQGAEVFVDGLRSGTAPVSLMLPLGPHTIRVEQEGYVPWVEAVNLAAASDLVLSGALVPLPPSPVPTVALVPTGESVPNSPQPDSLSQTLPAPTLPSTYTPLPAELPTNAAPTPTSTSTPSLSTATPPPPAAVTMREGQVIIPTYPYARFTTQAWNQTFNMPYTVLDRGAYDASNPTPADVTYHTFVVENEYLRLTFLPDLGGRLYEVVYKPSGHRVTYRNPVLKPSPWGPPEQGWWLAAGGFEWCLPVEEHGYEWSVPWKLTATQDGRSVTVILRDSSAEDRVRATITVRLEAGASYFTIQPRLENPTAAPLALKYWTNAMLAPGGQNGPSAELRFVLPDAVSAVTVHSRGDESLPDYNERLSWPVFDGLDLSRLGNWNRWLGFFEDPALDQFIAVYDEGYDEGVVRVFPADIAQGAKGFAFGWNDPIPASNWTDDGSSYVELHGGLAPTFDQSVTIPAGDHLQWTETWYPVAGLGALRYANGLAALNLEVSGGQALVTVAVTHPWAGRLVMLLDNQEYWQQEVSLLPGQPFRSAIALGADVPQEGRLTLLLETPDGAVAAEYSAVWALK